MKLTEKLLLIHELDEGIDTFNCSMDTIYTKITEISKLVTGSDRSSLFIYNPATKQLESQVAVGMPTKIYVNIGEGIVGKCAEDKEIIIENDVDTTKNFNSNVDLGSGYVTRNTLTIPVLGEDEKLLGVIQVLNKDETYYDEKDEELLLSVANISSVYITKCQLK